jgi:hypothetical protein
MCASNRFSEISVARGIADDQLALDLKTEAHSDAVNAFALDDQVVQRVSQRALLHKKVFHLLS